MSADGYTVPRPLPSGPAFVDQAEPEAWQEEAAEVASLALDLLNAARIAIVPWAEELDDLPAGHRESTQRCGIAKAFADLNIEPVHTRGAWIIASVDGTTIEFGNHEYARRVAKAWRQPWAAPSLKVDLPPELVAYAENFDRGAYPHLIEGEAR